MSATLSKLARIPRQLPFTLFLLFGIVAVGFGTSAHRNSISARSLRQLGFSPSDLWALDLERLATSAVATHGGAAFWSALAAIALFVGMAEWRTGSARTMLVFVSSHVLALVALAVLVSIGVRSWHLPMAGLLSSARDVGPSAGYFGCAGLWIRSWSRGLKRVVSAGLLSATLWTLLAWTLLRPAPVPVQISSALAHVLAFPLGWALASKLKSRPQRSCCPDRL